MVNTRLLRSKIEDKHTTVSEVAAKMGVDKATLYRRIANSESFTIGEAGRITEILGLTHEEAVSIFLALMSHKCDEHCGYCVSFIACGQRCPSKLGGNIIEANHIFYSLRDLADSIVYLDCEGDG